jgi:hypothetical protein
MKKSILILTIFVTISLFTACSEKYVSEEPTYIENRTSRPSENHIWMEGNMIWNRQSQSYHHNES